MATDEAPINRLPFDCFSKVLGYLGRKDLLASVKTSQKFNDAASLLLYRSVEVLTLDDANNAIEAYERRPELADQTQSFMVEQSATFYHSLKAKWQFEAAANLKNVKTLCFSYKPLLSQYTKEGITLKEDYERHLREGAPLAYGRQQNSPVLKSCVLESWGKSGFKTRLDVLRIPTLERLELENARLDDLRPIDVTSTELPSLLRLRLDDCHITSQGLNNIFAVRSVKNLSITNLKSNEKRKAMSKDFWRINPVPDGVLADWVQTLRAIAHTLEHLSLRVPVTAGQSGIPTMRELVALKYLAISATTLWGDTNPSANYLSAQYYPPNLETLRTWEIDPDIVDSVMPFDGSVVLLKLLKRKHKLFKNLQSIIWCHQHGLVWETLQLRKVAEKAGVSVQEESMICC